MKQALLVTSVVPGAGKRRRLICPPRWDRISAGRLCRLRAALITPIPVSLAFCGRCRSL